MEENPISPHDPHDYVERVLRAYRQTPTTMGTVRQADRLVAAELQAPGVSLQVVQNAFLLAAARRLMRAPGATPLTPIRSLAYFLPVIEEVMEMRISPNYFLYLESKLRQLTLVDLPR